jgi:NAD-dependent DNA ligase
VWRTLVSRQYDDAICEICDLTESEWVSIVGANGSRIYNSLKNRLGDSSYATFYGACRYMGIGFGVRKAKALLSGVCEQRDDVLNLTVDDIIAKDGFDTKTASMVVTGIPPTIALMDKLCAMGVLTFVKQETTSEFTGMTVVMTGFRDANLHATIESMGGKVGSGVSKKTTHLLCMDTSSTSSKMLKAREFGAKIMTPD